VLSEHDPEVGRPWPGERNLTFSVIASAWGDRSCCRTLFFDKVMSAMYQSEAYRMDPREADVLIPAIDTLKQCWSLNSTTVDKCTGTEGEDLDPSCSWCCSQGVEEFTETVMEAAAEYGVSKRFVYFKNTQDTAKKCGEFVHAKVALAKLPVTVYLAGFNLETSRLTRSENIMDRNMYPIPGINLLVPLHPSFPKGFPVSDEERESCDLSKRPLRASFSGHTDFGVREKLFSMEVPDNFFIRATDHFGAGNEEMDYKKMLRQSVFAYAPRGDEHYSFRLTEILAAGAVPVVVDDDYTSPYGMPHHSDWFVRVPEHKVESSVDTLSTMSDEDVCSLMRNGAAVWRFAKSPKGMVAGLLDALGRA